MEEVAGEEESDRWLLGICRLEELREQDMHEAQELEAKMELTNLLWKAEGVKIRAEEGCGRRP